MSTALTVRRQELAPDVWGMITSVAPVMYQSRLFRVGSEAQAMAIMAKGFELGLTVTAAFEFIDVIGEKPALNPRGALALIHQSGELAGLKIEDDGQTCKVWMKRRNGVEFTTSFSMEEAEKAQLVKDGSGWAKYPRNMRQWRAIGFCADVVFPDVLGGLKRTDELGADLTPAGDTIEGSVTVDNTRVQKPQAAPEVLKPDPHALLNQLVQRYGAEAVMVANQGKIPGTMEELTAVQTKLEAKQ